MLYMGTSARHLRVTVAGRPDDQIIRRSRDVRAASVKHVFWIQLTNTSKPLWQVSQDLIVNGAGKKFSAVYGSKNSWNKNKAWWVQGYINQASLAWGSAVKFLCKYLQKFDTGKNLSYKCLSKPLGANFH